MKKRLMTLIVLTMMLMASPTPAADVVSPSPPSWVPAQEYIVFPGSEVYKEDTWAIILKMRSLAESGRAEDIAELSEMAASYTAPKLMTLEVDPLDNGYHFELALIDYKLNLSGHDPLLDGKSRLLYIANRESQEEMKAAMWKMRARAWKPTAVNDSVFREDLLDLLQFDDFDRDAFLRHKDFDPVRDRAVFATLSDTYVMLDGILLISNNARVTATIHDGRSLVPIRAISEALGATVTWDDATKTVTLARAQKVLKLTIDQITATVNGNSFNLDVAPVIINNSTMLPLRFIAEQFSQDVQYKEKPRVIRISEDMTFPGAGEMKQWFIGCAAIIAEADSAYSADQFCMLRRSENGINTARRILGRSWGCNSREDLIDTIQRMTSNGHNANFLYDVELINSLSAQDFDKLVDLSGDVDKYMFPYVKALGEKWGAKGIGAWDWYRMTHIAGWGYIAGYLDLSEAFALTAPAIQKLKTTFSSWEEANENYLDGYAYWSRTDVNEKVSIYSMRLQAYDRLKAWQAEGNRLYFDPSLWK
ncbi:MAG: stalk domain-containing protein [Clostridiales bacterium]|nr:stalk domain-containing protein [Clostridiales bacterium]